MSVINYLQLSINWPGTPTRVELIKQINTSSRTSVLDNTLAYSYPRSFLSQTTIDIRMFSLTVFGERCFELTFLRLELLLLQLLNLILQESNHLEPWTSKLLWLCLWWNSTGFVKIVVCIIKYFMIKETCQRHKCS